MGNDEEAREVHLCLGVSFFGVFGRLLLTLGGPTPGLFLRLFVTDKAFALSRLGEGRFPGRRDLMLIDQGSR